MDNGNFPNIFKDGIPLNKTEYIALVKKGVEDGTITNVDLNWKVDVGTNNKDYMVPAYDLQINPASKTSGVTKIPRYNKDGSRAMMMDNAAIESEASMVYDAIKKGLNKRLTGQLDANVNSGDFNSARYGIDGSFTDVVSNPTYNYAINPLARNADNEQEMANMINQIKTLQANNSTFGMGVGTLGKDSELEQKNDLALKVYNLWIEDLNTWINNPKRSNTDAIAPIGTLAYMPVYDKAKVGDKTHAGYELKFSPEWLASKVKGPKDSQYGSLTTEDIKKIDLEGQFIINQDITIDISDVEISSADIPGWQVMNQDGITVALDITLSEELKEEGLARELVNRIQNIRKDYDFEVTDKIEVDVEKNDKIDSSISNNLSYICGETLANSLNIVDVLKNDKISVDLVDDISVNISIKKI